MEFIHTERQNGRNSSQESVIEQLLSRITNLVKQLQSTSSTHEVLQLAISLDKKNWVKVINIAASKNYDMLVHFRKTKTAYLRNYYILQSERRLKRIDKL